MKVPPMQGIRGPTAPTLAPTFVQYFQGRGAQLLHQLVVHLVCKGHGLQKGGAADKLGLLRGLIALDVGGDVVQYFGGQTAGQAHALDVLSAFDGGAAMPGKIAGSGPGCTLAPGATLYS
eukprot:gene40563-50175_t